MDLTPRLADIFEYLGINCLTSATAGVEAQRLKQTRRETDLPAVFPGNPDMLPFVPSIC
jgi:hypothetical protein